MQTTARLDDATHLARLEGEGGLLKLLLHHVLAEESEVAVLPGGGAVGLCEGEVAEGSLAGLDALLVGFDDLLGLFAGPRDLGLYFCGLVLPSLLPILGSPHSMIIAGKTKGAGVRGEEEKRTSRQLLGRLDLLCLTSRCAARICPPAAPPPEDWEWEGAGWELWLAAM